jgi:hypothetical protein
MNSRFSYLNSKHSNFKRVQSKTVVAHSNIQKNGASMMMLDLCSNVNSLENLKCFRCFIYLELRFYVFAIGRIGKPKKVVIIGFFELKHV